MWLRRIELKNFKRLVDFRAEFSPGINVIKGPLNEMGKSTLLESIIVGLFQNPKSSARGLRGYVSWGSARPCQISLEFQSGETRYLLEKDFGRGSTRLANDNGGEEIRTFREISEKIAELLGTNSEKLFSCTSCIRQTEVRAISSSEREIGQSLEQVVSGGEENTLASRIIQTLDDKISEMKKGLDKLAKTPGILAVLRNKLRETSQNLDRVKSEVSGIEARKVELADVSKQLGEIGQEYERASALLEKNRRRRELEASIQQLTKEYDATDRLLAAANELATKIASANAALRSIEGLENEQQVSEYRRKLDAIASGRESIGKDLAQREAELAEARKRIGEEGFRRLLASAGGMAVAVALLVGGVVAGMVVSPYFLSLAIPGVICLALGMRARITVVQHRTRILGIEERIRRMKEALDELDENERKLLAGVKCATVAEFEKKGGAVESWLKERERLEAQLRGTLAGRTIEDLQNQRREIARALAVKGEALTEDLTATRLSPEAYVELERRVQNLKIRQDDLDKQKRRCEVIIEQARFSIEDQIKLEEEIESLQEQLRREERKLRVYDLAREFISRARAEVLSSAQEALEREIQEFLAVFTNGKYRRVKVNKEALEFWVYSDEKEDWAKPEELSGGAIDEFYLAFRLALVKLIFGGKRPPLILDDPFVNFDSIRLARTLDFLKTMASDYQIIIFTLGDYYDRVADKIILLEDKSNRAMV